ncbi:MAG: glycosyltransferase [Anaerolineae bacterium]|nr:glycosyltransferase [Anaerolineae bacterium]
MQNRLSPTISVIIPVYNGTNFLHEAVDSVLAQTWTDYELVVIDDGSTDGTWNIIQSYGERVRGFHKPNGGVASALNMGLEKMRGRWFAWLSHDDLWLPNKLARQIEFLHQYPQFRACYTDYFVIDSQGTVLCQVETPWYPRAQALRVLFGQMYMGGSTMLVERTCFDRVGRFSESLRTTQDVDMWLRLLRQFEIGRVPEKLVKERIHLAQDSRKVELHDQEKQTTFQRLFQEFGVAGLFPEWASSASEPQVIARAHTWFADTMARYRGYDSLAAAYYVRALALDPSLCSLARSRLIAVRIRQHLRVVYHQLRRIAFYLSRK